MLGFVGLLIRHEYSNPARQAVSGIKFEINEAYVIVGVFSFSSFSALDAKKMLGIGY